MSGAPQGRRALSVEELQLRTKGTWLIRLRARTRKCRDYSAGRQGPVDERGGVAIDRLMNQRRRGRVSSVVKADSGQVIGAAPIEAAHANLGAQGTNALRTWWLPKHRATPRRRSGIDKSTPLAAENHQVHPVNVNLDIAATVSAVLWPTVLLVVLIAYRKRIPAFVEGLASRVRKLELPGFSLELAVAKPFIPDWSGSPSALDLRHSATAIEVNDSTARTFLTQLTEEGTADYAEVNLGSGQEWLTSRLFIMSIVFARMKGIRCFVFVETSGTVRRRYVGSAAPATIRWALARRYPWMELAYAEAYATILSEQQPVIVSNQGRLGSQYSPTDPGSSIDLLKEFLQRIQASPAPPVARESGEWALLDAATNTYEHAGWITSEGLDQMLARDFNTAALRSSELRSKTASEQLRTLLSVHEPFVAVTTDDQRFEYLIDRSVLLEQVGRTVSAHADGRSSASWRP